MLIVTDHEDVQCTALVLELGDLAPSEGLSRIADAIRVGGWCLPGWGSRDGYGRTQADC